MRPSFRMDRVGTVEAGKLADLIAVPGNPLSDIKVTEQVGFVIKGGGVYWSELAGKSIGQSALLNANK
jgi:imidazolonepropionase-like amidohydrolase